MFTKLFWKDAVERAVSTAAQTLATLWGADALFNVLEIQWEQALGVSAGAALLSLVKALAAAKAVVNNEMSPASLVTRRPNDLP